MVDPDRRDDIEGVRALLELLRRGRYKVLKDSDAKLGERLEGCGDELPVFISPVGFDGDFLKSGVSDEDGNGECVLGVGVDEIAFYPHILIAWKGVGVQEKKGLQLGAKLRAFEAKYLGWFEYPFDWVISKLARVDMNGKDDLVDEQVTLLKKGEDYEGDEDCKIIERISPSRKLNLGFDNLVNIFLPIRTQEPTYQSLCIIYRRQPEQDKKRPNKLLGALKSFLGIKDENEAEKVPDDLKNFNLEPFCIEVLSEVPWAALNNFLPGRYLSFATKDVIRVDFFTIAGLVAAATTYFRQSKSSFVILSILASLVYYIARILFSIQSALNAYHRKITGDILRAMVGKSLGGVLVLGNEAVQTAVVECCLLLRGLQETESREEAAEVVCGELKEMGIEYSFVDSGRDAFETLQRLDLLPVRHRQLSVAEQDGN